MTGVISGTASATGIEVGARLGAIGISSIGIGTTGMSGPAGAGGMASGIAGTSGTPGARIGDDSARVSAVGPSASSRSACANGAK